MYSLDDFNKEIEQAVEKNLDCAEAIYRHQHDVKQAYEKKNEQFLTQSNSPYRKPFNLNQHQSDMLNQARYNLHAKIIPKARLDDKLRNFKNDAFDKTHLTPETRKAILEGKERDLKSKALKEKQAKFNRQNNHGFKAWNDRRAMNVTQERMAKNIQIQKDRIQIQQQAKSQISRSKNQFPEPRYNQQVPKVEYQKEQTAARKKLEAQRIQREQTMQQTKANSQSITAKHKR